MNEEIERGEYSSNEMLLWFIIYLILLPFFIVFCIAILATVFLVGGAIGGLFLLLPLYCLWMLYPLTMIYAGFKSAEYVYD